MSNNLERIGNASLLLTLPLKITIKNRPYILTKNKNDKPILFSAICSHAQGIVEPTNSKFWQCPFHFWTYNPENGVSINQPNSSLSRYEVIIKNNELFADLKIRETKISEKKFSNRNLKTKIPKITLISHACILVEWNDFKFLMDPWLDGLGLCGSWTLYPPPQITVDSLPKIDAIWISHEHSDHLHPYTLSLLDKEISVYVPDFDNERLAKIVKKIGFKDVFAMSPFQPFYLTNSIEAISFKTNSHSSDNILYLRTGDFTMLNFNDSGINWNIKDKVGNVDLICAQFSRVPATTYPTNWIHLDDVAKKRIIKEQNASTLKQLKLLIETFKPRYFLPNASFVGLYSPEHLKYQKLKKGITLNYIKEHFQSNETFVLDLLPGEFWDGEKNKISRIPDRERFFDLNFMYSYLKELYESNSMNKFVLTKSDLTHTKIKNYFLSFRNSDLVRHVGNMRVCITSYSENKTLYSLISFKDGDITYDELGEPIKCEISISLPVTVLTDIIENDLSWDESFYWSTFHREPDVYNLVFWKLLHAPWRARGNAGWITTTDPNLLGRISIATLIEKGGNEVKKILEKNGLFCFGCPASITENISDGCAIHGISYEKRNQIIQEIKSELRK